MATKYVKASNHGQGFITHEDQTTGGLSFAGAPADIWVVTGTTSTIKAWADRVSGTIITKKAAQAAIDASLDGVTDPMTNEPASYTLG